MTIRWISKWKLKNLAFKEIRYLAHRISTLSIISLSFQTILWHDFVLKTLGGGHPVGILCREPVSCSLSHSLLSAAHQNTVVVCRHQFGTSDPERANLPCSRSPAESLQIVKYLGLWMFYRFWWQNLSFKKFTFC